MKSALNFTSSSKEGKEILNSQLIISKMSNHSQIKNKTTSKLMKSINSFPKSFNLMNFEMNKSNLVPNIIKTDLNKNHNIKLDHNIRNKYSNFSQTVKNDILKILSKKNYNLDYLDPNDLKSSRIYNLNKIHKKFIEPSLLIDRSEFLRNESDKYLYLVQKIDAHSKQNLHQIRDIKQIGLSIQKFQNEAIDAQKKKNSNRLNHQNKNRIKSTPPRIKRAFKQTLSLDSSGQKKYTFDQKKIFQKKILIYHKSPFKATPKERIFDSFYHHYAYKGRKISSSYDLHKKKNTQQGHNYFSYSHFKKLQLCKEDVNNNSVNLTNTSMKLRGKNSTYENKKLQKNVFKPDNPQNLMEFNTYEYLKSSPHIYRGSQFFSLKSRQMLHYINNISEETKFDDTIPKCISVIQINRK